MAGKRVPGQRPVRGDRGAMERERPRRRLAQAPSRAAAACTPTRRPAEQPLKRREQRGAMSAGAEAPEQWPLCSGAHGCGWVRALVSAALPRTPGPSAALRRPPSRDRAVGALPAAETAPSAARRCPASPSLARRALAHVGPPPPALAALRPPLRPPRRFPARRIPGNCARPRPALPLGLLGLVVRHAGRPARVGCALRSRCSALGGPRGAPGRHSRGPICEVFLTSLGLLGCPRCSVPTPASRNREGGV
ncbi:atherin-like [Cricetulus griseus]|uniref:Atherin-like n=1 Tax=Cricetulus griseus TaxID=10029 RepID=A0A9J7FBV9_CRIGR|nr:atherin-like [Cricetulus griseus]XP_035297008.1 atherin-like [Cricetulus griseus]